MVLTFVANIAFSEMASTAGACIRESLRLFNERAIIKNIVKYHRLELTAKNQFLMVSFLKNQKIVHNGQRFRPVQNQPWHVMQNSDKLL